LEKGRKKRVNGLKIALFVRKDNDCVGSKAIAFLTFFVRVCSSCMYLCVSYSLLAYAMIVLMRWIVTFPESDVACKIFNATHRGEEVVEVEVVVVVVIVDVVVVA